MPRRLRSGAVGREPRPQRGDRQEHRGTQRAEKGPDGCGRGGRRRRAVRRDQLADRETGIRPHPLRPGHVPASVEDGHVVRRHLARHLPDFVQGGPHSRESRDVDRVGAARAAGRAAGARHHARWLDAGHHILPHSDLGQAGGPGRLARGLRPDFLLAQSWLRHPHRIRQLPAEECGRDEQRVHHVLRELRDELLRGVRGVLRARLPRLGEQDGRRQRRHQRARPRVRDLPDRHRQDRGHMGPDSRRHLFRVPALAWDRLRVLARRRRHHRRH